MTDLDKCTCDWYIEHVPGTSGYWEAERNPDCPIHGTESHNPGEGY